MMQDADTVGIVGCATGEVELQPQPVVSVIIPTIGRPELLRRALRSVLSQSFAQFEIIVIIDGPDDATIAAMHAETDPRIRFICNAQPQGAGRSRNRGVAEARGRFVAFLDDDDEWLSEKLAMQIALIDSREDVLVTCLTRVIRPQGSEIWPVSIYDNAQSFDEYLFDRRQMFAGSAFIQTSSQFLSRSLALRSPFPENSTHDDWEFVLRLACAMKIRIETVSAVLVNHYIVQASSLSTRDSWKASLVWVRGLQKLMTRRAYGGFCLGVLGPRAAKERAYAAILPILREAYRRGAPRFPSLLFFILVWMVPEDARKRLRLLVNRMGGTSALQQKSC
jgi:glycosyltransferase involved in cell wall biosynthesis